MDENGPTWARGGLIFGIVASIAGNVANACLTPSAVSLLLLVPLAVVWPFGMFLAIEVLVRNRRSTGVLARIGQGALLTVAIPTAVTSFVNLHGLMVKAGEPGIAQLTGPLAIDGLMMGCTIMLLASRGLTPPEIVSTPVSTEIAMSTDAQDSVGDMWDRLSRETAGENVPTSPAPAGAGVSETTETVSRGETSPVLTTVIDEIIAGQSPAVRPGASRATISRYMKVWRTLRDNPNAEIDAKKAGVRQELIGHMRAAARFEVVR